MRLVLVGAGRVGLALIEHALAEGVDVTLVESNPQRVVRARLRFGVLHVVEGDATDEKVLREAGADRADALVAATPDDPTNLMVAAVAKRLGVPNVVARANEDEAEPLYAAVKATAVKNPSHLTAERLYHAFEVPTVRAFMPVGEEGEVATLALSPRSRLVGRPVREAGFPRNSLLVAVNRRGRLHVPSADFVLAAGDVLTLVVEKRFLEQIVGNLAGRPIRRFARRLFRFGR